MVGKKCKIKGNSEYFIEKYGTANPTIEIEDTDRKLFGKSWMMMGCNPAAMLYGIRSGLDGLPLGGTVYYGKIGHLGELETASEGAQ